MRPVLSGNTFSRQTAGYNLNRKNVNTATSKSSAPTPM
jgi:hypothetical protein